NKATELCTTWGDKGQNLYLLGLLRPAARKPGAQTRGARAAEFVQRQCRADRGQGSGTQLIQDLIAKGCHAVTRYQATFDKTVRLNAQKAFIENGFVHLPETAPWLAEYLHEMTVFPKGEHDDQVDSTTQSPDWFKPRYRGGDFRGYSDTGRSDRATPQ